MVGGVAGFYNKADGGCDRATFGTQYAKNLEKAGAKTVYYDKPKPAKLADGSVKNVILGYCVADIELVTKAGTVVLPYSHIDIIEGPEKANLIYIGEAEEKRLKLRFYAEQIEDLAKKGSENLKRRKPKAPDKCACCQDKVNANDGEPRETDTSDGYKAALLGKPVIADGHACVGEHDWKVLKRTPYVLEPMAQECYVTTAALRGGDVSKAKTVFENGVAILDLDRNVKKWLGLNTGIQNGMYTSTVSVTLRIFPDENRDTIQRLTKVLNVNCRVVKSEVPALVIGRKVHGHLLDRKAEQLEFASTKSINHDGIRLRLEEMLESARAEGMSDKGLKRAQSMIAERFYNIWRLKLQPGDVADMPPLEIELKDGMKFELPKPYRRRYTPAEMKWWRARTAELCRVGVLRASNCGQLSPSNLLPKKREGIILTDDFRLIADMRGVNKCVRPMHFALPRLDTMVHHLAGSTVFAKGDKVNGYWQCNLAEKSRKYTAFDSPVGAFEHCRAPQGYTNSAPWFQKGLEGVLKDLLWEIVLLYLDDSLLHARNEEELLDALEKFFARLDEHNIKLHPAKFVLFAKALTWCGKQVSKNGIKPAPHRAESVRTMGDPETLADMMSFVYGSAWFRNHIIDFAKIAAPLYDMWKDALAPYKKKTKAMAKRFNLKDMPAWENGGRAAFENVKRGLVNAIETSFFDPKLKTCVFGDASDEFWCLVITQCKPGVERLPWKDQEGKHKVLVIE